MNVGSLFSGIGGLDLGLERAGMSVRWQCEIDPYCRAVLAHHWPDVPCYPDIKQFRAYPPERVDLICGGFPCQPVSVAGKGLAQKDPRWLWPEFARVVGELRPRYVLVENVPGLRKRGLGDVVGDLASLGYDAEWNVVSAATVGAPHLRKRLFLVAYASGEHLRLERGRIERAGGEGSLFAARDGEEGDARNVADPDRLGRLWRTWDIAKTDGRSEPANGCWWSVEPDVGRVAYGVPNRLAQLRALGNAVVPQVAEAVGRMILAAA